MTTMKQRKSMFLLLGLATLFALALVAARALYTGQLRFTFLLWNLFLAWLPFLFAETAVFYHRRRFLLAGMGSLWLLFLPNAPYLVTDLIHLRPTPNAPLWYDAIMLFSFALTGLFLGFLSLYRMQMLVTRRWGVRIGWLFAAATLMLSSFGVYIGRFLRWNSWDVFTNPHLLLTDIATTLLTPHLMWKTAVISTLLSAVLLLAYGLLAAWPQVVSSKR